MAAQPKRAYLVSGGIVLIVAGYMWLSFFFTDIRPITSRKLSYGACVNETEAQTVKEKVNPNSTLFMSCGGFLE